MRSSQEIAAAPVFAIRRAQKVFPAPDIPISASRSGFAGAFKVFFVKFAMKMRAIRTKYP
jgi:hypothetical protein